MSRALIALVSILACMLIAGCAPTLEQQVAAEAPMLEWANKNCKNVLSKDDVIKMSSRELFLAAHASELAWDEIVKQSNAAHGFSNRDDTDMSKSYWCLKAQAFQKDYLKRLAENVQRIEINQQMEDTKQRR